MGLAMSQDGRNWARIEAGHHTGALFDVGEEGQWDNALNGAPQVPACCSGSFDGQEKREDASKRDERLQWRDPQ